MIDISGPAAPPAPDVAGATREAIETEVGLLPERLAAELEFAPQFAEAQATAQFGALAQFAPQFAEIFRDIQLGPGADITRAERALQEELFPEEVGVERALGARLGERLGALEEPTAEIPEEIESAITERFRAEEAAAGRQGSPVGSLNVARQLGLTGEEIRRQRAAEQFQTLGQALSFAGRVPFASGPAQVPVAQPSAGGPRLTGGLTSQQLGLTGSIFGAQAGLAGEQAGARGAIIGGGLSGLGGALTGIFG